MVTLQRLESYPTVVYYVFALRNVLDSSEISNQTVVYYTVTESTKINDLVVSKSMVW